MLKHLVVLLFWVVSSEAFLTVPSVVVNRQGLSFVTSTSTSTLQMSGFGASSSSSKNDKKKTDTKLKPKQQWDRYTDLKGCESIVVAVKVVNSTSSVTERPEDKVEWFQVGTIRSKDNAFTEAAVVKQRLLIAEHSRRLFPLQIFAKDTLEWAYMKGDEYVPVGKVEMPDGIEKLIGFVGLPDATGFYTRNTESLVDNSVGGFAKMKKKGIVGFIGMEVHD